MRVIRAVDPWSVARFLGGFWFSMGLIVSLLALFGWLFGLLVGMEPGPLFLSAFLATIAYGALGYLSGLLAGFVYNLVANAFGGIRIDIE